MPVSRRTARGIALSAVAAGAIVGAGAVWQRLSSRRDRRRFPHTGRLVDVGGRRVHLHVSGSGGPVVVLESGIAASSLSWQRVQPEIARFTTVVSYDRAGLGWSDAWRDAGAPQLTLRTLVDDLRAALAAIGGEGPFVLAGHSFGGLIVRAFAARYPQEVAGLVLVDPLLPAEWIDAPPSKLQLLGFGVKLSRRGAWLAQLGIVRLTLNLLMVGARTIPQYVSRLSSGAGSGVIERLIGEVRKLPEASWPAVQAHWSQPRSFVAMAAHLEALPDAAEEVGSQGCGAMPVTILSASDATPEQNAEWTRLAATSPAGKHIAAISGGHWLHLDAPELVIEAVRELVELVRALKP